MTELVTELKQVSPEFREWWPRQDVQGAHTGQTHLNHPLVGMLTMKATTFKLVDYPDLQMIVYTPIAGTDTLAKLTTLSASGSRIQFLKAM